jgi:broad specificity polyphosphatase/5'/3'-nucleotidase SurE
VRILVTNDDGIDSEGLFYLAQALEELFGHQKVAEATT